MLSILIVDDEKIIRAGIRKILVESIGLDIRYSEAKNGEEALEIAEKNCPDLVITDIRMPKMDGLELMRRLNALPRKPSIVVLSGYDEFAYARESIRNGVVSYILKPVDRNELVTVVTDVITRIEQHNRKSDEKAVSRVMSEARAPRAGFFFEKPYRFAIVTGAGEGSDVLALASRPACYTVERRGGNFSLLIHEDEKSLLEACASDDGAFIGMSGVATSLSGLNVAWRQAELASCERLFDGNSRLSVFSEAETPLERGHFESVIEKLDETIGTGNVESLIGSVDELFVFDRFLPHDRARHFFLLREFIEEGLLRKYRLNVDADAYLTRKALMISNIELFRSLDECRRAVRDFVVYLDLIRARESVVYPFVIEALEFIRAHFRENINMAVVANHVSVNYTWFSEKFKEQMGTNFNDYLKGLRISEAKRLLERGCYRVYEVARESGFGDVKYFARTFKHITGLSPGEYGKRF